MEPAVLAIAIGLGLILGFLCSRARSFQRMLIKVLWLYVFALIALIVFCLHMKWDCAAFCSAVAWGAVLAALVRAKWLSSLMPINLRMTALADCPAGWEPSIGYIGGMWVLTYIDGTVLKYDQRGYLVSADYFGAEWRIYSQLR